LNLAWEQGITHRQLVQQVSEHRHLAANWLTEVATVLEGVVESGKLPGARTKKSAFRLTVSATARSQRAGTVSGDIYLTEILPDGRHLLLLSDGMGVGTEAAQISQTAVSLLRDLLAAGMDLGPAVKTLNALLLLQAKEERFTTLDVALVDLTDGRCQFVKSGAAPTFIKRGEMVSVIRGESVPVGILPEAPVETVGRVLRGGDLLVFLTDGLWEAVAAQDGPNWVEAFLRAVPESEPAQLAEALMARVDTAVDEPRDDRSLLVVRVEGLPGQRRAAAIRRPKRAKVKPTQAPKDDADSAVVAQGKGTPVIGVKEKERSRPAARTKVLVEAPTVAAEPINAEPESTPVEPVTEAPTNEKSDWAPVQTARTRAVRRTAKKGG
jgi:serine/threonine protein phosphatase PrpC